ncbi:MAG: butyrate kinase [Tractidigestivibacter sp.]|uniref:butyrate kinase n=1 Tax=Tractidigestivibacter sp. TaxID=2847320 RepID=UPI003D90D870
MAEKSYRILAINPGSTSTKIGLFEGEKCVLSENVAHDAQRLAEIGDVSSQLPYRRDMILDILDKAGVDLSSVDAFVGRGGGLLSLEGGVYAVDDTLLADARRGANGVQHPAQLGSQLAHEFAEKYGKPAFVVNPPDTDELCDDARMTGIKGVYRNVHLHALNLKETAIRHAKSLGRRYEDCDFIVCHIGGGISVSAHKHGRMIDGYDIVGGEGPMTPTRAGAVPVVEVLKYLKDHDAESTRKLCQRSGGFADLLGTSDAIEVCKRADEGDEAAKRAWSAMEYQLVKYIASMAGVLHGHVDGILLGGGMVHNQELVDYIREGCGWIAPVTAYPGEFELEAMAAGAVRALSGEEAVKRYTGQPVFTGFACFE